MAQTHALYRFFGAGGTLLYIGITNSIPTRLKQHNGDKEWWLGVSSITVEHYPSREAVLEAERRAIIAERPLYNDTHNAAGRGWRNSVPQQRGASELSDRDGRDFYVVCMDCGNSITEEWENGLVHIRHSEVSAAQKSLNGTGSNDPWDCSALKVAMWQVHCGECNPHRNDEAGEYCAGCYAIDAMRIQTWRALMSWTSHLSDKAWLTSTDWHDMVGALARGDAEDRFMLASAYVAEVA
jgi:hypothetical protein